MAGPEGFEPPPAVLETVMLPLTPRACCDCPVAGVLFYPIIHLRWKTKSIQRTGRQVSIVLVRFESES